MENITISCSGCFNECGVTDMVVLFPCQCNVCFRCALSSFVPKRIKCPLCGNAVTEHETKREARQRGDRAKVILAKVSHPNERKKNKTTTTTMVKVKELSFMDAATRAKTIGKGLLITEQTLVENRDSGVGVTPVGTSYIPKDGNNLTRHQCLTLINNFKNFHSLLISTTKREKDTTVYSPSDLLKKILAALDLNEDNNNDIEWSIQKRLTFMCMFALVSGRINFDEFDFNNAYDRGTIMTTTMIADLIHRAMQPKYVGPAVRCMTNIFNHASTSLCHDTLAQFRITTTLQSGLSADARRFIKDCVEPDIVVHSHDFAVLIADNINFKITQGKRSGTTESWSLIAHRLVNESELQKTCGAYKQQEQVSRKKRLDWEKDVVEKKTKQQIIEEYFLPSDSDYEQLRRLDFVHKKVVLMMYDTSNELNNIGSFQKRKEEKRFMYNKGFPKLERVFEMEDVVGVLETIDTDQNNESEISTIDTIWELNNIIPSIPVEMNFGRIETLTELLEYMNRYSNNQVAEWEKNNANNNNNAVESPIASDFMLFCGDGDPIHNMASIKYNDATGNYKRLIAMPGIFHSFMEIFRLNNKLHFDLISFLIRPFYSKREGVEASDKNISFFLNFNDPTVPEREVGSMIFGINLLIIFRMKESGRVDATPNNMLKFMVECATNSPQDLKLKQLLDYMTLMLLYRKAERKNKVDLYFVCMRLSLPLLATTNATKYMHIYTDMLVYWATCSPLEQQLIRHYGFTVSTPNGITIGVNFGHEKYVRLVRDSTGKIWRRGSKGRLEYAALCRMNKQQVEGIKKRKVKSESGAYYNKKAQTEKDTYRRDGYVLINFLVQLLTIGSFSQSSTCRVRENNNNALFLLLHLDQQLHTGLLHPDSNGTKLVKKYVRDFCCSKEYILKRGGLKKLLVSFEDIEEKVKDAKTLATSVTKSSLKSAGTKDELIFQVEKLRSHFPAMESSKAIKKLNKDGLIELLVKWRREFYNKNEGAKESLEKEAEESAYGGRSTFESRREEVGRKFHSSQLLNCDELANYRIEI